MKQPLALLGKNTTCAVVDTLLGGQRIFQLIVNALYGMSVACGAAGSYVDAHYLTLTVEQRRTACPACQENICQYIIKFRTVILKHDAGVQEIVISIADFLA